MVQLRNKMEEKTIEKCRMNEKTPAEMFTSRCLANNVCPSGVGEWFSWLGLLRVDELSGMH